MIKGSDNVIYNSDTSDDRTALVAEEIYRSKKEWNFLFQFIMMFPKLKMTVVS